MANDRRKVNRVRRKKRYELFERTHPASAGGTADACVAEMGAVRCRPLEKGPMNDVTLDTLEAVGGALAHKGRLRILALLRDSDLYVCQIRTMLGLAASTVSAHLGILRHGGLVSEQKEGRWVRYGLTDEEPVGSVVREILHLVKEDRQVIDDARRLEALRRVPLDRLCRAGLDLTAMGIEGRKCRRRSPPSAHSKRVAPVTRST
jgi:ArsR family transcriptional regulator, arsenate/arsenite/antimonite-responsive transcriptional repressor